MELGGFAQLKRGEEVASQRWPCRGEPLEASFATLASFPFRVISRLESFPIGYMRVSVGDYFGRRSN